MQDNNTPSLTPQEINVEPTEFNCLNIGFIEASDHLFDEWKNRIHDFFSYLNTPLAIVNLRPNIKDLTAKNSIIATHPIDIVVSDVSLGLNSKTQGLNLLKKVKDKFPSIFTVAFTREPLYAKQILTHCPALDLCISKTMGDADELRAQKILVKKVRYNCRTRITYSDECLAYIELSSSKGLPITSTMIERTVRSLTWNIGTSDPTPFDVENFHITPITTGFTNSRVFQIQAVSGNQGLLSRSVVKFSKPESANQELANFKRYVDWHLPSLIRPHLKGVVDHGESVAICYSYALEDSSELEAFGKVLNKNKDYSRCGKIIKQIFSEDSLLWHQVRPEATIHPIKNYRAKLFEEEDSADKSQKIFYELLDIPPNQDLYEYYNLVFEDPIKLLFSMPPKSWEGCICHGDLHAGNILTLNDNYALIDFQSTGPGHIYEDFVTLESSVQLAYAPVGKSKINNTVRSFSNSFGVKTTTQRGNNELVRIIRFQAQTLFGWNEEQYLYALAMKCLSLLRITRIAKNRRRRAACITAYCLHRLREIWNTPSL